jgi:deoxyribonuclease-4
VPLFGSHVSSAGGLSLAVARARALGCDAFQVFTRNANRWRAAPLEAAQVRAFREALDRAPLGPVVSHGSYLVNLAAPEGSLRTSSLDALGDEIDRAEALGLRGVVVHPGSSGEESCDVALERIGAAIRTLLAARRRGRTMILLEQTAGQGRCVGHRFEHLARLIELADGSPRVGVCLDTCHLLAAGYDIATPEGYRRTFAAFSRLVGFDRLQVVHANDSKRPCGSRVDRHAHIGDGYVGLEAFGRLVNDRRLARLPLLLETEKLPVRRPTDVAPDPLDAMNLARLRSLVRAASGRAGRPLERPS